jgi:hypothetical protein
LKIRRAAFGDRLIFQHIDRIRMDSVEQVQAAANFIDLDVQRAGNVLRRHSLLNRPHDHPMFLNRRDPADFVVVGIGIILGRDQARGLRLAQLPQRLQPHVPIQ